MDDSFAFRTTVSLRSRLDPGVAKVAVLSTALALGIGLFARWVVVSGRESWIASGAGLVVGVGANGLLFASRV